MQKRPLVVGSAAFDVLFDIRGRIQDEILLEKDGALGRQSMMFTAKGRKEYFGGTGANIAYGLGLLGKKPLLFSLAGNDFRGAFEAHLRKSGVDSRVVIARRGFTAAFYGMSDEEGQQIGVYQPNAYEKIHTVSLSATIKREDFENVGVAIFSAGTGRSVYRHMKETRAKCGKDAVIIFDPGQVISVFYGKKLLEKTLALADIFIGNEVECRQLQTILGYDVAAVLQSGPHAVIETRGEKGSVLYEAPALAFTDGRRQMLKIKRTRIPAARPKKIVEATGAGDAYRAGLISKLLEEKSLKDSCAFGARVAARSVAFPGGQTYHL